MSVVTRQVPGTCLSGERTTRARTGDISPAGYRALLHEGIAPAWVDSQLAVADRCGRVAGLLLERIEAEAEDGRGRDIAGCATAIGILIDKAQLLTGAATSRSETIATPDDAVRRLQELYGRLEQRATSIPAASADAGNQG